MGHRSLLVTVTVAPGATVTGLGEKMKFSMVMVVAALVEPSRSDGRPAVEVPWRWRTCSPREQAARARAAADHGRGHHQVAGSRW